MDPRGVVAAIQARSPIDHPSRATLGMVAFSDGEARWQTIAPVAGQAGQSLTQLKGYVRNGLLNMVWGSARVHTGGGRFP
jgi:hypothetical protein